MASLDSIARQYDAQPGNMSAYGANFLNDWGPKLAGLLTPVYEYFFGSARIPLKKSELDSINKKMERSLSIFKSKGMLINMSCRIDGVKQILVLEETKQGVKMSCNGKTIILKNVKDFFALHEILKKEIYEVIDELDEQRMRNSKYAIDTFSFNVYLHDVE